MPRHPRVGELPECVKKEIAIDKVKKLIMQDPSDMGRYVAMDSERIMREQKFTSEEIENRYKELYPIVNSVYPKV